MELTKGKISREQALVISKDYVEFVEGDFTKFSVVLDAFSKLRRNQKAITYLRSLQQFFMVKITSVNHNSFMAVDGPIVRVGNGEYTWRVDGDKFAFPV